MVAFTALNTQRETMRNEDSIRLHGIMTRGGISVNSIPSDVTYEGRVRGGTIEAIADANMKMDRCMRAGALTMGATVEIVTITGYLPMKNNPSMIDLFKANAETIVDPSDIAVHPSNLNRGGSTDMGDLSQVMPVIHPYTGAATGTGHDTDYVVQDYVQGVVNPAMAMAMTAIDLLTGDAEKAKQIIAEYPPTMTRSEYIALQNSRLVEESYVGE